jgi:hypothetical protein
VTAAASVGRDRARRDPHASAGAPWDGSRRDQSRGVAWNPMWHRHLSAAVRDARSATYGRYVANRPSRVRRATRPNRKPIPYFAPVSMRRVVGAPVPHSSHDSR